MAGDWIKMRLDLQSHPKIVRILSATKSDKFRVIGGLHAVWAVFDTHSTDGRLDGYTADALDHIIGWPGFAEAVIAVGWLLVDGPETLILPEFDEHNGKSGKRRAEDQKRKRGERKSEKCPQNVHKTSAENADEIGSREEKRREEKEEDQKHSADAPKYSAKADLLASGVAEQTATDWLKLRAAKKAPATKTALDAVRREADAAGLSLDSALAICCTRGWQGFKASWVTDRNFGAAPPGAQQLGKAGQATARAVEELLRERGHG